MVLEYRVEKRRRAAAVQDASVRRNWSELRQLLDCASPLALCVWHDGAGKDLKSAQTAAYAAVGNICFEGVQFRRDIAAKAL